MLVGGGGGGGGGGVGGSVCVCGGGGDGLSYIWLSMDVRPEWPAFPALQGIWLASFFSTKSVWLTRFFLIRT